MRSVEGLVTGGFKGGDGGVEFAGGDFGGSGVDVAEFAGGEVGFAIVPGRLHGRAEGAADNGARFVEVTGSGGGVEYGAGLVVGEFLPPQRAKTARWGPRFKEGGGLVIFGEDAGDAVAWKPGVEAGEGVGDAFVDAGGAGGVGLGEGGEAFAEAGCVLLRDGEDSDAALGAAGAAYEMRATASGGGGESGGYDLNEVVRHGVDGE